MNMHQNIRRKDHGSEEEIVQLKSQDSLRRKSGQETEWTAMPGYESASPNKLPGALQAKMENSFDTDFSGVDIRTGSAQAGQLQAKAFTKGNEVHFAPGQYDPASQSGQQLIGHELGHIVQQRQGKVTPTLQMKGEKLNDDTQLEREADQAGKLAAAGKNTGLSARGSSSSGSAVVQRTAVATWEDAKDSDRLLSMSANDQATYAKQQAKIAKGKTIDADKLIKLPDIEKIMKISARYHYYEDYPLPGGGTMKVDQAVLDGVRKEYRMGATPDFWPNIFWQNKDDQTKKIGVRFNIEFVKHDKPADAGQSALYSGQPLEEEIKKENKLGENFLILNRINEVNTKINSWPGIDAFLKKNAITGFAFNADYSEVVYTPSKGGDAVTLKSANGSDAFRLLELVHQEAALQGKSSALDNDVLGLGNSQRVIIDPVKSGLQDKEYKQFGTAEGETYSKDEMKKIQNTNLKLDPEQVKKRLISIFAHEIGHNIGFGHSEGGIMSPEAEQNVRNIIPRDDNMLDLTLPQNVQRTKAHYYQYEISVGADTIQYQNIQALVDRIKAMSLFMHETPNETLKEQRKKYPFTFWSESTKDPVDSKKDRTTPREGFIKELEADNMAAIFSTPLYRSLMSIPYESDELEYYEQVGTFTTTDVAAIKAAANRPFNLEDWNKLSVKAKAEIKKLSRIRSQEAGSGITAFGSIEEMNAY